MICVEGTDYELKYNMDRLSMIEKSTNCSLMSELNKTTMLLPIHVTIALVAYGIKVPGENSWIAPDKGQKIAKKYIEEFGPMEATMAALEQIQENCGFLFMAPKTPSVD